MLQRGRIDRNNVANGLGDCGSYARENVMSLKVNHKSLHFHYRTVSISIASCKVLHLATIFTYSGCDVVYKYKKKKKRKMRTSNSARL